MRKVILLMVLALLGCKQNKFESKEEEFLQTNTIDSITFWDNFRMQIAQNDPNFDLLKYYDSDKISENEINNLIDDEYTKSVIKETTFDQLQDEIFDDQKAKALYVLVASQDITIGTIYYFQFTSNGLQLIGTMPY